MKLLTTRYSLLAALIPVFGLMLLGAGCLDATPVALDGGIFRSADNGATWKQLKILNLGTKLGSLADLGTVTIAADPQDPSAVYVGTVENGLLYSLDGGESWSPAKGLTIGRVNAVAIDPKDKCTVYAAKSNQIFKTKNCSRDWNQVFFDPRLDKVFTALTIDWFNRNILYAGTSEGDIFRSDDGANTWRALERVEGTRINNLVIDPRDSRIVYAATGGAGILKTIDAGAHWDHIIKPFQDFESARRPTSVVVDPIVANRVYEVSKYGILRSDDGGANWKPLTLPTPPGTTDIRALVIHPKNPHILVYASDTSLIFSVNEGTSWTPKKPPTGRGISSLIFTVSPDPVLFLGAAAKPK